MTFIQCAVRCVEFFLLEYSYEILSRLMLILDVVWLSCATVTKSLSSCNLQHLHLSTRKEVNSRWLYRESCSSKKMVSKIKHRAIQQPGLTKLVLPIVSMGTVNNSDLCSIICVLYSMVCIGTVNNRAIYAYVDV